MSLYVVTEPQKTTFVADADGVMREFNRAVDAVTHIDAQNIDNAVVTTTMAVAATSDRRATAWLYDVANAAAPKVTQAGSHVLTVDDRLWTTANDGGTDMVLTFTTDLTMPMQFGMAANASNGSASYPCVDARFVLDGESIGICTKSTSRAALTTARLCLSLYESKVVLPGTHTLRVQLRDRSDGTTGCTVSAMQFYATGLAR